MSIFHRDKCTKEEAQQFRDVVFDFLEKEKIAYSHLKVFTAYNGEVRIYTGKKTTRLSQRRVMQKDEGGYFRAKKEITETEYIPVYRADWNEEEKDYIRNAIKNRK